MFLIKILGNAKTGNLDLNIRYKNMIDQMSYTEKLDEILNCIEFLDEPITLNLSSLLQVCCQFTLTPKTVKYLLTLGANPNYLDANGCSAYNYVDDNEFASEELKEKLKELLDLNKDLYPIEDKKNKENSWMGFPCYR